MNRPLAWLAVAGKVLVEAGLLSILPLIFSRSFSEQFTYPKKVLSEAVIIVAAAAWILGALLKKSTVSRPSAGRMAWPLFLLALVVLISSVNSPVPAFSLRESVYFLCGPAWALLLMGWTVESQEREVRRLYLLSALGGTAVALVAALQWAGHDPLLFGGFSIDLGSMVARMRVYATFGNPNFVAGYLVATVFLGAALAVHSSRLAARVAWGGAVAVMLAAIVGTGSRGAWIGLAAGLVTAIVVLKRESGRAFGSPERQAARAGGFLGNENLHGVLPGLVCLVLFSGVWREHLNAWIRHLEGRVFLWRAAWPMFTEHPILGGGWATFQLRFLDLQARALAGHPEMLRHWTNTGQLHNDLLQFLLETGVLGLLAWGWLLWVCMKRIRAATGATRLWLAASVGGITAILVDSLFNFQFAIPPTFILMFTLLAVLEMLGPPDSASSTGARSGPNGSPGPRWGSAWRLGASLGVVTGAALLLIQIGREAVAERDYALGIQLEARGEMARAEQVYRHGIQADPLNGLLHFGLARALYVSERYPEALEEVPRAERTFVDSHLEVLKARIEDQMGLAGPALETYRRALALDPTLKTVQGDIERLSGTKVDYH